MNASPNPSPSVRKFSYRDSGVDIAAGNELVARIAPLAARTCSASGHREQVLGGVGGFAALFEVPLQRFAKPVLVTATDGVGSKVKLAAELARDDVVGIDLVAMCVNDLLACGAEPLCFLDYFATSALDLHQAERVVRGIADGCEAAGCALVGGETAEMPGMYAHGEYDLAGFAVGMVDKENIITPARVRAGDVLLGLQSSGVHANGFSLIRQMIARKKIDLDAPLDEDSAISIGEALLAPTRIYVKSVLPLLKEMEVSAVCHITGGGLLENPPRVLPPAMVARIDLARWQFPPLFRWLQTQGNLETMEMLRTFNCGIGMVVVVHSEDAARATEILQGAGEIVHPIGQVEVDADAGASEARVEIINSHA